jgi:hypothetical protein
MTASPFDDVRLGECNACGKMDEPLILVSRERDRWRCFSCYLWGDVALCSWDRWRLAREREAEARRDRERGTTEGS